MHSQHLRYGLSIVLLTMGAGLAVAAEGDYRLPAVDLKQRVIWGATCDGPDGAGFAFGGQDQQSDDGLPHTRIRQNGQWKAIHVELRRKNPLQPLHDQVAAVVARQKLASAYALAGYFNSSSDEKQSRLVEQDVQQLERQIPILAAAILSAIITTRPVADPYVKAQARRAVRFLELAEKDTKSLAEGLPGGVSPVALKQMSAIARMLEAAAECLDAEPPPRALSPIVYDRQANLYLLFGGDHCDYLMNDTWVFDPAKQAWQQRHPAAAPSPRANHKLAVDDNGKITLHGGYKYTSNTDYCGGQYADIGDGPWTYYLGANRWTGPEAGTPASERVYRTGPFHPDYYLDGPKPDAAAVKERLENLAANTWVALDPPRLPRLNRDWGTAVIDPDRDLILRFSGGHSAHGGTDVLHYHLTTNRWELTFPVEFPLGQLYSNTSYPEGYSLNRRPWVTGHTYQSYAYDPGIKKMLFAGQQYHCYVYDPTVGDWIGRGPKPKGMSYDSCFYDVTLCGTPQGTFAWTKNGEIFRFDADKNQWDKWDLTGVALPGAVVDNSTLAYDARRDRLLFARKLYGRQHTYDGELYVLDVKSHEVSVLSPAGSPSAGQIPYLCQIRYDVGNDVLLVGATLPPDADGLRRTPACDCAADRWVSLRITGQDPNGKEGRNVSLGLMYDAQRKLFWAVDTNSQVYVLRLDLTTAEVQPL